MMAAKTRTGHVFNLMLFCSPVWYAPLKTGAPAAWLIAAMFTVGIFLISWASGAFNE